MKKPKKKITTSDQPKRPRGNPRRGLKVQGTDEKFTRDYPGQDPKVVKVPEPKKFDPEEVWPEPKDEGTKHKYPPPKRDPTFRKVWMQFIDNISGRDNFKVGHLNTLEILCDLHVEYEELRRFLRKNGRSYQSYGRAGMQWKFFPEVGQLNNVQAQIKEYMKILGLLLTKDKGGPDTPTEKNDWT